MQQYNKNKNRKTITVHEDEARISVDVFQFALAEQSPNIV